MNPTIVKLVVGLCSLVAVLGKGLLAGSFDGEQLASTLTDVLSGLATGAVLFKRPEDISPRMLGEAAKDNQPGA